MDGSRANEPGTNDASGAIPGPSSVELPPSEPLGFEPTASEPLESEPLESEPLVSLRPVPQRLVPSQAPAGAARRTGPSRWPLRIAIFLGVMSLLCVGGLGIAYHLYDKATAPNRSAPDVVVDNYLRAFFVHRDENEAAEYLCPGADTNDINRFRESIDAAATSDSVGVTWLEGEVTSADDGSETVPVGLTLDIGGGQQNETVQWLFEVQRSRDWCVAGARPTS